MFKNQWLSDFSMIFGLENMVFYRKLRRPKCKSMRFSAENFG
jgi:hypothetical protein